jgi:D-glycero-alpha-D-manno-heptose-7-phosphate kinase
MKMATEAPMRRRRREDLSRKVILTRTPLRVSFAGGGTDLPAFYEQDYGAVFSTAIDHYIYVTVKRHGSVFDEPIRLNYRFSEEVHTVDDVQNDIARECLRFCEIEPPIYISTIGDLPTSTGLGSSSSFAVGLLNALHAYRGERVTAGQLADEAAQVEIEVLKHPIGKQDQYAAAFGGLNFFTFKAGGGVSVEPHRAPNRRITELFSRMLMFWTGHQRDATSVLIEQKLNTSRKHESLLAMREHAHRLQEIMTGSEEPTVADIGGVLHETWSLKRDLASTVTTPEIDAWYERAIDAGAAGGKLLGAGGGGFLMFVVEPDRQDQVRRALADLREISARYEVHGSQLVLPFVE